ncbi:MAG: PQQ-binding-like beta-propeller repeat protein, partial [Candidatus Bathyarchaeota archaeon]|nr:PQQ-binding-like beta-propeller repeat protein [Candidatus Termiticorpusculum sp.]
MVLWRKLEIKNIKYKKAISTATAILLMLSFVVSIFAATGITNAQSTASVATWSFVDAIPTTAGVGQPVLINWGLLNYLNTYNDGWNVTLQITYPNNVVEKHDGKTWSTGTVGKYFEFKEPGEYQLQCIYKGEMYNNREYLASQSDILTIQILENYWKDDYPAHSPPDEYWTRPIDSQQREWWSIAGSWVTTPANFYAPYNDAPESAHILWRKPIGDTLGGLSGGDTGDIGYQHGDAYEGKFTSSVIIAGILYYNRYVSNAPRQTVVAVDLHTGKTLWEKDFNFGSAAANRVSRGQIFNFITENNRGTWAYLWFVSGTNMYAVDPQTGDLKYNMTDVPSGTIYVGPNGEMLKYQLVNYGTTEEPNYHLLQWNSTYVVNRLATAGTSDAWGSQIQGKTFNASLGYNINISIPQITTSVGSVITAFPEDRVVFAPTASATDGLFLTAISIKPKNVGQVLFYREQYKAPVIWADLTMTTQSRWAAFSNNPYVAIFWTKENRVNYAFSLETGQFLYETEPHGYADAWTNAGLQGAIVNGKLYEASLSGVVYCYDAKTGKELWTYEATDIYNESYYSEKWWLQIVFISDGKVYLGHMDHSPMVPINRGAPFFALDAETGDLVWEITGAFRQTLWGGRALIGDSIIATMDLYDQQICAIGKGPSSMTLTAPDVAVAANAPVLIRGTIMDVSPGTESDAVKLRFPKGVPAVSDACMSEWMLYVYKQFSEPHAVGVPVRIDAIDPNGNYVTLGETVSDANGRFSFSFTPDKEGQYDIYAFFDGSNSYY